MAETHVLHSCLVHYRHTHTVVMTKVTETGIVKKSVKTLPLHGATKKITKSVKEYKGKKPVKKAKKKTSAANDDDAHDDSGEDVVSNKDVMRDADSVEGEADTEATEATESILNEDKTLSSRVKNKSRRAKELVSMGEKLCAGKSHVLHRMLTNRDVINMLNTLPGCNGKSASLDVKETSDVMDSMAYGFTTDAIEMLAGWLQAKVLDIAEHSLASRQERAKDGDVACKIDLADVMPLLKRIAPFLNYSFLAGDMPGMLQYAKSLSITRNTAEQGSVKDVAAIQQAEDENKKAFKANGRETKLMLKKFAEDATAMKEKKLAAAQEKKQLALTTSQTE